jgi:hypothetical protein
MEAGKHHKERGRRAYILRSFQDEDVLRSDYDGRHPEPLAYHMAPTHITHDGQYLMQIVVPLSEDSDTIQVFWRQRSRDMIQRGCDACVGRHSTMREHCSANLPPEDPRRVEMRALCDCTLPTGRMRLIALGAGRQVYGGEQAAWEWDIRASDAFGGDRRHTGGSGRLRLVTM